MGSMLRLAGVLLTRRGPTPCRVRRGSVNVAHVSSSSAAVDSPEPPTRVHVTGAEGSLARRVLALLADDPIVVDGSSTASDVVVHLGAGDHDLRARRRRERHRRRRPRCSTDAIAGHARHLVLVSSAMVYGAYANNPVPLTEDAILRPDVDFVYARQLATVEAMADRWRRTQPGRTVTVLRPVVAMAADGTSSLARGARRRLRPTLRRGGPAGAVPPPRRPRQRRGAGRRPPPGRCVQRRPRRLGRRRAGARAERGPAPDPPARPRRRGRLRGALAVPAGPDPARAAQLHARAVDGRQRPAEGRTGGRRR